MNSETESSESDAPLTSADHPEALGPGTASSESRAARKERGKQSRRETSKRLKTMIASSGPSDSDPHDSVTISEALGARFYQPTIQCPKAGPWCSTITIFVVLMIMLFMLFMSLGASYEVTVFLSEKDTVLIANLSSFWYGSAGIKQQIQESDEEHLIQIRFLRCSNLTTHVKYYYHQSEWNEIEGVHSHFVVDSSRYLLAGSAFNLTVSLAVNDSLYNETEVNGARVYVFDSDVHYFEYLHDLLGDDAVLEKDLQVGNLDDPFVNDVTFTAKGDGYYFIIVELRVNTEVYYQYNISERIVYLNIHDYDSDHDGDDCDKLLRTVCLLKIGRVFAPSVEYCLIGQTAAASKVLTGHSNTTHTTVVIGKNYGVLIVPTIVTLIGCLLLLLAFVTEFSIHRWKKRETLPSSSDRHAGVQYHKLVN